RVQDKTRVPERRKRNPEDPSAELCEQLRSRLDRQPRFAGTAGSGQRHQTLPAAKHAKQISEFLLAPHKRTRWSRQVGVRDRPQRRKPFRPELEQPDRLREVLQAMLPEVDEVV